MLPQIRKQALSLALEHRQSDPELVAVYVSPEDDEVRIIEVSKAVATTHEIIPFWFAARPDRGLPFPTRIIVVSEAEFDLIQKDELGLPDGWCEMLEKLDELEDPSIGERAVNG